MGHARYNDIEVGLSSQKGNTPLKNHYMITSFERDKKVLRELETLSPLSSDYRDGEVASQTLIKHRTQC